MLRQEVVEPADEVGKTMQNHHCCFHSVRFAVLDSGFPGHSVGFRLLIFHIFGPFHAMPPRMRRHLPGLIHRTACGLFMVISITSVKNGDQVQVNHQVSNNLIPEKSNECQMPGWRKNHRDSADSASIAFFVVMAFEIVLKAYLADRASIH